MMGSGKSYWGKKLAALMDVHFFDLDAMIEEKAEKTISEIFEQQGEATFRQLEKDGLHSMEQKDNFILATGGGTPCFFDNMNWMNEQGITIWIDEPVELLAARLMSEKNHRPIIKNIGDDNLVNFLQQKRQERFAFYSKAQFHLHQSDITEQHFLEIIEHE